MLGYLPRLPQAVVESRHLGLKTAGEITDLAQKISLLSDALEADLDWATLEVRSDRTTGSCPGAAACSANGGHTALLWHRIRHSALPTPKRWTACALPGRSCVLLSPVRDTALPEGHVGLYLPAATRNCMRRP